MSHHDRNETWWCFIENATGINGILICLPAIDYKIRNVHTHWQCNQAKTMVTREIAALNSTSKTCLLLVPLGGWLKALGVAPSENENNSDSFKTSQRLGLMTPWWFWLIHKSRMVIWQTITWATNNTLVGYIAYGYFVQGIIWEKRDDMGEKRWYWLQYTRSWMMITSTFTALHTENHNIYNPARVITIIIIPYTNPMHYCIILSIISDLICEKPGF